MYVPDANANEDPDAQALPQQDAVSNLHRDPDGYAYDRTLFDANSPPHGPAAYSDTGEYDDAELAIGHSHVETLEHSDEYFTADRDRGHITAVTHHHPDGSAHDAIPDFTARGAFECIDCGANYRVIVWRSPDQPN